MTDLRERVKAAIEKALYSEEAMATPRTFDEQMSAAADAAIAEAFKWMPIEVIGEEYKKSWNGVLLKDEFGVALGFFMRPQTLEEWWSTVGNEDEEPDVESYQEYLEEEPHGWVSPTIDGVEYINPKQWMPLPPPSAEGGK